MLTFDGVWHFGEVFSSRMNPGFHCTGQMADTVYGGVWVKRFADVNVVDRVAHGGGGVMVVSTQNFWNIGFYQYGCERWLRSNLTSGLSSCTQVFELPELARSI